MILPPLVFPSPGLVMFGLCSKSTLTQLMSLCDFHSRFCRVLEETVSNAGTIPHPGQPKDSRVVRGGQEVQSHHGRKGNNVQTHKML